MQERQCQGWFGLGCLFDPIVALLLCAILLPTVLIGYPVCQWSRKCWVRFVKWKHPNCIVVEDISTRSILDQGKNQGIYTLLVDSPAIVAEHLRNHLVHLASSKPLLRMALTNKCCWYAWERLEDFFVDNHLVVAPISFKGRPITEANIQDYVSDVTSKFLPTNCSPWQVQLIGGRYCLVRVHHLLLHQEQLALGDFLPLGRARCWSVSGSCESSPFANLYSRPEALPRLHQKLTESFSNVWNEFLSNNDPTERPEILKKRISLWQCAKIAVIVCFSTGKEISRQYERKEGISFWPALKREARKRNFGWSLLFQALLNLLNPLEIFRTALAWLWYLAITASLKLPILFWRELRAASLIHEHYYYPDSLVSILSYYLPLLFSAGLELLSILMMALGAPIAVTEQLFRNNRTEEPGLRTGSQSGRKVVAWSEEIELCTLKRIAIVTGASETEILVAAIVDSLKEYFRYSGQPIPDEVLATAKFTSQRALYFDDHEARGLMCLALPMRTPHFENDLMETLREVQKNIQEARSKQRAIYAITAAETASGILISCLPSVILKIILNHLTSRYSVSITHVDGDLPVDGVQSAVFWKPPQGNCSLSLTLHRHGQAVRLGVMGDAVIGPQNIAIARCFPQSLDRLARILGVSRSVTKVCSSSGLSLS